MKNFPVTLCAIFSPPSKPKYPPVFEPQNNADSKSPKAHYVQQIPCMASRVSRCHDVPVHEDRHGPPQDDGRATFATYLTPRCLAASRSSNDLCSLLLQQIARADVDDTVVAVAENSGGRKEVCETF